MRSLVDHHAGPPPSCDGRGVEGTVYGVVVPRDGVVLRLRLFDSAAVILARSLDDDVGTWHTAGV